MMRGGGRAYQVWQNRLSTHLTVPGRRGEGAYHYQAEHSRLSAHLTVPGGRGEGEGMEAGGRGEGEEGGRGPITIR